MLKTKAHLETKTAASDHVYNCASNTPITEVIEALQAFLTYAYGILKQQQDQQKAQDDVEHKSDS